MIQIYHNPKCGTSRNALALIREAGREPEVIEYLKNPPDSATLHQLIAAVGGDARHLLRSKEALCAELGLDQPSATQAQLIEAMLAHPILLNRPIVVSERGTRLCRPAELVRELI